mmetsp:Transcript_31998/g.57291  ORF Transcript_31998/g.57291 Transcript_31998/m.57291 type:complete len:188 (-) Transcript_31998:110-673(-)
MPFWIFGFGSLVSRPGFEYADKVVGYVKDYRRVFYQGSTDHRGVPDAPGRTVTLEPCVGQRCWGAAFLCRGSAEFEERVMKELEWREKQYDHRAYVDVFTDSEERPTVPGALTFIATPDTLANPNYLGPAPLDAIARQIATSRGPSGPNYEYLFSIADAMREIQAEDAELYELEAMVQALMQANIEP